MRWLRNVSLVLVICAMLDRSVDRYDPIRGIYLPTCLVAKKKLNERRSKHIAEK